MNMSAEEDCEDLPSITVNSSAINSSTFAMPTAEELAEQRARELECERRLEMLRQRAIADERSDSSGTKLRHSDSSGSEGELALAAAVTALSVRAERPHAAHAAPCAAALWAALAPPLPPLEAPGAAGLQRATDALACALAAGRAAWPDDEVLCAGALLSVAVLSRESRSRRAAARALHALLDDHATPAQVSRLTAVMLAAMPQARVRLQLSDALRSGGDAGADRAAFALTAAAMLDLLRPPGKDGETREAGEAVSMERVARAASAWRACDAASRYVCVQLTGRLLAATSDTSGAKDATSTTSGATDATSAMSGATDATSATSGATDATSATQEVRDRLLAHLAPPPAAASDAHRPDRLKALVGASKLKLLFCAKNAVSRQPRAQRDTST